MLNHAISEEKAAQFRKIAILRDSLKLTPYEREQLALLDNPDHVEGMLGYIRRQRAKNAPTM